MARIALWHLPWLHALIFLVPIVVSKSVTPAINPTAVGRRSNSHTSGGSPAATVIPAAKRIPSSSSGGNSPAGADSGTGTGGSAAGKRNGKESSGRRNRPPAPTSATTKTPTTKTPRASRPHRSLNNGRTPPASRSPAVPRSPARGRKGGKVRMPRSGLNATKSTLSLVKLPDNKYSAKCLDGSPPAYYLRTGTGSGANSWLIFLQGGGWCTTAAACAARAKTVLGGTGKYPQPSDPNFGRLMLEYGTSMTGILSNSSTVNPDFHNWNLALVLYCDGGGFAGTRRTMNLQGGGTLHLDGSRVFKSVLEDLYGRGLLQAKSVLFAGCSAGAQAVASMCDRVATYLPRGSVKCMMDGGFFLDGWDVTGRMYFRDLAMQVTQLHRPAVEQGCGDAYTGSAQYWRCFFPQYNVEFIDTPVFVVNSINDYAAIQILNFAQNSSNNVLECLASIAPDGANNGLPEALTKTRAGRGGGGTVRALSNSTCTAEAKAAIKSYGANMLRRVQSLMNRRPQLGSYLLGGSAHCTTIFNSWSNIHRKGMYMRSSIADWYFRGTTSRRVVAASAS